MYIHPFICAICDMLPTPYTLDSDSHGEMLLVDTLSCLPFLQCISSYPCVHAKCPIRLWSVLVCLIHPKM
jgi:hypothetical protein